MPLLRKQPWGAGAGEGTATYNADGCIGSSMKGPHTTPSPSHQSWRNTGLCIIQARETRPSLFIASQEEHSEAALNETFLCLNSSL